MVSIINDISNIEKQGILIIIMLTCKMKYQIQTKDENDLDSV